MNKISVNPHPVVLQVKKEGQYFSKDQIGMWIDIDKSSGGYPYCVDNILRAAKFPDNETTKNYCEMFGNVFNTFYIESVNIIPVVI